MARNTGRMALYEAISKGQRKQTRRQLRQGIVRLRPGWWSRRKKSEDTSRQASRARYSLRSSGSPVRASARRSYWLAGLIVAAMVLVVLGGVQLARRWTAPRPDEVTTLADPGVPMDSGEDAGDVGSGAPVGAAAEPGNGGSGTAPMPNAAGDNVIVIATYGQKRDLEPVQQHFAAHGIGSEIVMQGDRYFLVTRERFSGNPASRGADGYPVLQRIKDVGATYKAPPGYEPFGVKPFQDAYGMKVR
jgi:hypothetical protein